MVDDFEVKTLYEDRTYERHQFSFSIDGKEFKGDYHEDEIHWLHPHPKQDLDRKQLEWVEKEVHRLLSDHEVIEDVEGIEVTPMLEQHSREAHQFKLTIDGEEFKGMVQDGNLEWFHPKPRRKMKEEHVKKVEKKVHEKMRQHLDEEN